jgi:hypothetical protein
MVEVSDGDIQYTDLYTAQNCERSVPEDGIFED